ncbi:hypothetical protein B0H17DRAFT_1217350 [Mycena rosella]|uniref:Uncharacterized protein n=1 Tax=Mycena rosella TaxID=1033263 RepID=A0AAD7BYD0_MYCRO|nr:hypothetical protein B0H17DRAFT_1217350 [Mycena rosella]
MRLNSIHGVHPAPAQYHDWNDEHNHVIQGIAPSTFMLNYEDKTRSILSAQQVQLYCGFNQTVHCWHCSEDIVLPSQEPPGYNKFLLCVQATDLNLGIGWGRVDMELASGYLATAEGTCPANVHNYGIANDSDIIDREIVQPGNTQVPMSCLIVLEANLVSALMAKETANTGGKSQRMSF